MNRLISFACSLALGAIACAGSPLLACGEGMFSTGNGLSYQGYLAPRPATVVVYATPTGADDSARQPLFDGLQKAGHTLLLVDSKEALTRVLAEQRVDVVIADYARIDEVDGLAGADSTQLLPVVARSERRSPQLRSRFSHFVLDGASVGQYLSAINGAMKLAAL